MTLIRVAAERAKAPVEAILEVLNSTKIVEIENGMKLKQADVKLEESREREGRTFWLWRLTQAAPRCVLSRGNKYRIEADTGAARCTGIDERWVVREGVAVERHNGSFDVAINESLDGANQLVDKTVSLPTGAYRSTVLRS